MDKNAILRATRIIHYILLCRIYKASLANPYIGPNAIPALIVDTALQTKSTLTIMVEWHSRCTGATCNNEGIISARLARITQNITTNVITYTRLLVTRHSRTESQSVTAQGAPTKTLPCCSSPERYILSRQIPSFPDTGLSQPKPGP